MTGPNPEDVTLSTLHEDLRGVHDDLRAGFADVKTTLGTIHDDLRAGFADVKTTLVTIHEGLRGGFAELRATLVTGFRSLPSRESSEEMVRLLREGNRLHEERFTQLDLRIREQHLEVQQVLRALVEGQRLLVDETRGLSADIKALIARLDALIKGRGDGSPTA